MIKAEHYLDFLDAEAETWANKTSLSVMANAIATVDDLEDRSRRIESLVRLGFVEGAYRAALGLLSDNK